MHVGWPSLCRLVAAVGLAGLAALALAGCGSFPKPHAGASAGGLFDRTSAAPAARTQTARTEADWRRVAEIEGERYRANRKDAATAMRYAEALRRTHQHAPAAAVLEQAAIANPRDKAVLGAYGRALAEVGDFTKALQMLGQAHTPDNPDWRILSAQGAVLDQMGRHAEARRYYTAALKMVPDEPSVLSNLGLSYALSKDLKKAEETLRTASAHGPADRRVRQNLALVVGLQGRFKEAEEIARADLPAEEAADNIAYLQNMLAQHGSGDGAKRRGRARAWSSGPEAS